MIETIAGLVNRDAAIVRWGRGMNETFMVGVGEAQYLLTVREGKIEKVEKGPFTQRSWRFAIRASADCWEKFCRRHPRPDGTTSSRSSDVAMWRSKAISAC